VRLLSCWYICHSAAAAVFTAGTAAPSAVEAAVTAGTTAPSAAAAAAVYLTASAD